jgi:phage gp29-like protein
MAETADTKATEDQAVPTELRGEIATIGNDITAQYSGFVLSPRDEVLATRGGGRGFKIYEDIKRDPHAGAVLRKRKLAVVARDWTVDPASEAPADQQAAELVRFAIGRVGFDRACLGLLDSILKGIAVAEIVWGAVPWQGRTWILPIKVKVKNANRFVFDTEEKLRLLTREQPMNGIELPDRKFILMRYGEEDTEDPYGLGLGASLFWPVFFKRKGLVFWMTFADKFGNPTTIGEYPQGAAPDQVAKLRGALAALSHDTGIIIPQGMVIKLLEAQRYGTTNTYETLCHYMDQLVSEATLGETLTTSAGSVGSQALGKVHDGVREELTDADGDLLCETLNGSFVRWIVELNLPTAQPPEVWRRKADGEDLNQRATRDKTLMDAGWEPEDGTDYFERVYGDRWIKKAAAVPPAPIVANPPPAFAAASSAPTAPAELADQLEEAAAGEMDGLIDRIRREIAAAKTLPELRQRLLEIQPDLDVAELAAVMGRAFAVADLTGRSEVKDGR